MVGFSFLMVLHWRVGQEPKIAQLLLRSEGHPSSAF